MEDLDYVDVRVDLDALLIHEETLRERMTRKQASPVRLESSHEVAEEEESDSSASSMKAFVFSRKGTRVE